MTTERKQDDLPGRPEAIRPAGRDRAEGEEMKAFLYPAPELPDETPLERVRFSTRIRNGLKFGGLETVGEVRSASDLVLLSFQDLGPGSVRHLRDTLGLKAMGK